jgi:hypothetical protein
VGVAPGPQAGIDPFFVCLRDRGSWFLWTQAIRLGKWVLKVKTVDPFRGGILRMAVERIPYGLNVNGEIAFADILSGPNTGF